MSCYLHKQNMFPNTYFYNSTHIVMIIEVKLLRSMRLIHVINSENKFTNYASKISAKANMFHLI